MSAAERSLQFSMTQYREGEVNYLDVVISQTSALQTQLDALNLDTTELRSSVQLIRALGGGWTVNVDLIARHRKLRTAEIDPVLTFASARFRDTPVRSSASRQPRERLRAASSSARTSVPRRTSRAPS